MIDISRSGCSHSLVPAGVWKVYQKRWMSEEYTPGLVSVIIPTHNCARFLGEAMDSVLAQTYRPIELIVVDDGSTDNTGSVLEEWGRNVRRDRMIHFRTFCQEQRGAPAARNKGLIESQGEYIQFLDADDILSPGKMASQVSILSGSGGGEKAAYGPWRHFVTSGNRILVYNPQYGVSEGEWLKQWLSGWFVPPHSLLWMRSDVIRLGPWDESSAPDDDGEYAMRYLASGGRLIFCPEMWVYYRQNPNVALFGNSLSGRRTASSIRARIRVARRMERFLAETGLLDDEYSRALSHRYYGIAKNYTTGNRLLRRLCLRDFRRLSRDGNAPGTSRHRVLARLFGFVLTQKLRFLILGVLRIPTQFPAASVRTIEELRTFDRPASQEPLGSLVSRYHSPGTGTERGAVYRHH
ncbi:MAG TPA: glycosyltransferase [Syntrophorhabdales bacterium]|nr:glycosyltransferase [Syntrophorhabdales bacterium]